MSLLMEALRKAEEAKRKIQNQNEDSSPNFSRGPASQPDISPAPVVTASIDTDLKLEEPDPDVTADYIVGNFLRNEHDGNGESQKPESPFRYTTGKPSRASVEELQNYLETTPELDETTPFSRNHNEGPVKTSTTAQQRAAGSVFAAKQKPAQSHSTRNMLLILLVLLIPLGGGIFWYLANSGSSSLMVDPALIDAYMANRSVSDEQIVSEPEPQPLEQSPGAAPEITEQGLTQPPVTVAAEAVVQGTNVQPAEAPASVVSPGNKIVRATPSPASTTAVPVSNIATGQEGSDVRAPGTTSLVNDDVADLVAGTTSSTVLEVSHSTGANKNNQQLLDAYASLQAGDFAAASTMYQQVLEQFPNNRDALLGSAAIALRDGNVSRARELYSRLMQLNPKDPLARTGLLQTIQDIDTVQYEQELRRLLQQFPDVAPLSFALGNVYATQQRWNEAQSAYFDAFLFARQSNDSAINPDYAYNLAVSLEQINQPVAALDYYRQAQILAGEFTPGFDMQALSRRISFLEQNRP